MPTRTMLWSHLDRMSSGHVLQQVYTFVWQIPTSEQFVLSLVPSF